MNKKTKAIILIIVALGLFFSVNRGYISQEESDVVENIVETHTGEDIPDSVDEAIDSLNN